MIRWAATKRDRSVRTTTPDPSPENDPRPQPNTAHLDPVVSGHHGRGPRRPLLQLAHTAGRLVGRGQHQQLAVGEEAQQPVVVHHVPRPVALVLVAVRLAGADVRGAADVAAAEVQVGPGEVQLAPHGRRPGLRAARSQHPDPGRHRRGQVSW